jgi:uncharacterized protein HemX
MNIKWPSENKDIFGNTVLGCIAISEVLGFGCTLMEYGKLDTVNLRTNLKNKEPEKTVLKTAEGHAMLLNHIITGIAVLRLLKVTHGR